MSSALVAVVRFISHGVCQILGDKDKFFWPRLACIHVRLLGGLLFWYKCLGRGVGSLIMRLSRTTLRERSRFRISLGRGTLSCILGRV